MQRNMLHLLRGWSSSTAFKVELRLGSSARLGPRQQLFQASFGAERATVGELERPARGRATPERVRRPRSKFRGTRHTFTERS